MTRLYALTLLLSLALSAQAEENYCQDAEANGQWVDLLAKAPDDLALIKLFALRAGLCVLVEQKLISLPQATTIFEEERLEVLKRRYAEEDEQRPAPTPGA